MSARRKRQPLRRPELALLALNVIGAAAAAGFASVGLLRPDYIEASPTPMTPMSPDASSPDALSPDALSPDALSPDALTRFWAASSAVRTWALTIRILTDLARSGTVDPDLLVVAGLVQLGDSALGIQRRNPRMAVAPALMGTVHLLTARRLRAG